MTLMKEERRRRRRRRRRRKKTILGFGDGRQHRNILRNISLSSLSLCDRIGAEPKKSSQIKRTFRSLRQNTNCIGHTLRRVWGRKRRKRERNARVFLSSSQRERQRVFLSRHPSSLKEEIWTEWLFNFIPTDCVCVCWFCCWDSLKRRERVYESFSGWVHRKTTTETTTTRR